MSRREHSRILTWASAADWDGVVHADFGNHSADRIELGYRAVETGMLAYWPLDEEGGLTAQDVVGSQDGTVQGATTGRTGVLGTTSYAFDGTDDYISGATDVSALRNTASLSFWLKSTQSGDDTMWQAPGITGVESNGDGNDIFWGWIDASGFIGVQAGVNPGAMSSTDVADGTWHHVVLTRDADSGEVAVYVDGTREDTVTSRIGEITTTFDSIGRIEDTAGTPEYFDGQIDEFQVYDRVLSASAVQSLYQSSQAGALRTTEKRFPEPVDPSTLSRRRQRYSSVRDWYLSVRRIRSRGRRYVLPKQRDHSRRT
ncbi:LamG domain-containing protein [Halorhabdus rudnickae]|uniref:LamG domain-containing protein n=1 Tax=Halorhabdus rudnickae TaxID=1775544 RepID=UPI001083E783|nr:LamG domain-containing protein [Halorhabdus rudnickae]